MNAKSLLAASASLALAAAPAAGTTWYVSPSGDDGNAGTEAAPFATIAAAFAVASDGDTIQLSADTHTVTAALALTSGIRLLGATDDPADTVVRRSANSFNILSSVASADALVAGISFAVPSLAANDNGTGIGSFTAGVISNCTFSGFWRSGNGYAGGAIGNMGGASNGDCVLADCTFENCWTYRGDYDSGGAVRITGKGTIRGCTFRGNASRGGGGAIASTSAEPVVVDCLFEDNWSGHGAPSSRATPGQGGWIGGGGAIYCSQSAGMAVSNCVFAANRIVLPKGGGRGWASAGGAVVGCRLYRCVVTNNASTVNGGALSGGAAYDCLFAGNEAAGGDGGATYKSALAGCTVAGNAAAGSGGGTYGGSAVNSIVYGNTAESDDNGSGTSFTYSCTAPAAGGAGNVSSNPALKPDWTLKSSSPCIDAGSAAAVVQALDLAGAARVQGAAVDMGCYERDPAAVEFAVSAAATGGTKGYRTLSTSFAATVVGNGTGAEPAFLWDMGDGTTYAGAGLATVSHTYAAPGRYFVTCTAEAGGESDTYALEDAIVVGTDGPVWANAAGSATPPYDTAEKGAATLAEALDFLAPGGTAFVAAGSYALDGTVVVAEGRKVVGAGAAPDDVVLRAANVRAFVVSNAASVLANVRVKDARAPNTSVAADYPHCGAGALLWCGTITNCVFDNCQSSTENNYITDSDGLVIENCGAVMVLGDATIADCVFSNCFSQAGSYSHGGGAVQVNRGNATIRGCVFSGNTARCNGGGVHVASARGATALIENCVFVNNAGSSWNGYGGAVSGNGPGSTVLRGCLLVGNRVAHRNDSDRCSGGGAYNCTLESCTVANNSIGETAGSAGHFGAGLYKCVATNCIVWANSNTVDNVLCNWSAGDAVSSFDYTCTSPLADGERNVEADPCFRDASGGDWRLSTGRNRTARSPLFGKGLVLGWMAGAVELDGLPRLFAGRVTPGCYESVYPLAATVIIAK